MRLRLLKLGLAVLDLLLQLLYKAHLDSLRLLQRLHLSLQLLVLCVELLVFLCLLLVDDGLLSLPSWNLVSLFLPLQLLLRS